MHDKQALEACHCQRPKFEKLSGEHVSTGLSREAHGSEAGVGEMTRQHSHQGVQKGHDGTWLRVDRRLHSCSTCTSHQQQDSSLHFTLLCFAALHKCKALC